MKLWDYLCKFYNLNIICKFIKKIIMIQIKSTMTVEELVSQLNSQYSIKTPKGNIAGGNRKLRSMTTKDISKGFEFKLDLLNDNFIQEFKKKTGITIESIIDYTKDNDIIPENKGEIMVCMSYTFENEKSNYLGCEITIGALDNNDVNTLIDTLKEDNVFDSELYNNWMDYDSVYHNQGVIIPHQEEDYVDLYYFNDCEGLSTDNWEFDQEFADSDKGINLVDIPEKGVFVITVRNEDVYWIAKGMRDESKTKCKVQVFVDKFEPLTDIWSGLGIVTETKINGKSLERDFDLESNYARNVYQINQFIIKDGKIIAWISSSDNPGLQWETSIDELDSYSSSMMIIDKSSFDSQDEEYISQKEELIEKLKK